MHAVIVWGRWSGAAHLAVSVAVLAYATTLAASSTVAPRAGRRLGETVPSVYTFGAGYGSPTHTPPDQCNSHADCMEGAYCDSGMHCWHCDELGAGWCDPLECADDDEYDGYNCAQCCYLHELVAHCGTFAGLRARCPKLGELGPPPPPSSLPPPGPAPPPEPAPATLCSAGEYIAGVGNCAECARCPAGTVRDANKTSDICTGCEDPTTEAPNHRQTGCDCRPGTFSQRGRAGFLPPPCTPCAVLDGQLRGVLAGRSLEAFATASACPGGPRGHAPICEVSGLWAQYAEGGNGRSKTPSIHSYERLLCVPT
jgi:hypothetical protein